MKKKLILAAIFAASLVGVVRSDTTTTRAGLTKPSVGSANWGTKLNANFDSIDSLFPVLASTNTFAALQTFSSGISVTTGTFSNVIYGADGSASLPGFSFTNDTNTGWYRTASDDMIIVTGGTAAIDIGNSQASIEGARNFIIPSGKKLLLDGSGAGDTYITEASANKMTIFAGATPTSTFTATGVSLLGTTTNDTANVGWVGEPLRTSVTSGVSSSGTGQFFDICSSTLTAGDWDITGQVITTANGATVTVTLMAITTVAGNSTSGQIDGDNRLPMAVPTALNDSSGTIAAYRVSISATTIYYLKVREDFSVATPKAYGRISARRVR